MRIFGLEISRAEKRLISSEFENAVNKALTADIVGDAASRPVITQESSLALSAVWACVRILSETVGILPIHLYKRTDRGGNDSTGISATAYSNTRPAIPRDTI